MPDLRVSGVTLDETTIFQGEQTDIRFTVRNDGEGETKNTSTQGVYISKTMNFADATLLDLDTIGKVAAKTSLPDMEQLEALKDYAAGTYYLFVKADDFGNISESNETNNVSAGVKLIIQGNTAQPDLRISDVKLDKTTIKQGDDTTIRYTVRNDGEAESKNTAMQAVYISTKATFDSTAKRIDEDTVGKISRKGSDAESEGLQSLKDYAAGTYYLFVKADDFGNISESNETNNVSAGVKLTIQGSAAQPDLRISDVKLDKTTIKQGDDTVIRYTVRNDGEAESKNTSMQAVYISTKSNFDGTAKRIDEDTVGKIPRKGSDAESEGLQALKDYAAGTYYLFVKADDFGNISESNETNNVSAGVKLTIQSSAAQPDLRISDVKLDKTTIKQGDDTVIRYTVRNDGEAESKNTSMQAVYISTKSNFDSTAKRIDEDTVGNVPGKGSDAESEGLQALKDYAAGTYYLFVKADDFGNISESNETNNVSAGVKLTIQGSTAKPDLRISDVKLDKTTIKQGDDTTIRYSVRNDGEGDSKNTATQAIYISTKSNFDSTAKRIDEDTVGNVPGKGSDAESEGLQALGDYGKGRYYLYVVADSENDVSEINENNNVSSATSIWIV